MTRFLGTPILAGAQKIGNLYFTDKIDGTVFTETDEELVVMFAAHASVAVQNAKLYEQVEQLAVLDERTRIGMDLHDGIIQSIYAMGLVLESTKLVLPEGSDEARRLLEMAVDGLNDAIKDIRNFIMDLRPRRFRGDLGQGLAQLVREFQANTLTPVKLNLNSAELSNLPTSIGRAVFLTTQEALANIARHAKADLVMVELLRSGGNLIYTIRDDGRGFDVSDKSRQVGHGLANMQARAEELNGRFAINSAPGDGTSITLRLPLTPQTARSRIISDNDF
jgi:signal transduction histidine kinase